MNATTGAIRTEDELLREWWWRHDNNLWSYNPRTHTTMPKSNWTNLDDEQGPIRVTPFVEDGDERFRSVLVTQPWKGAVEHSAHAYEMIRRVNRDRWLPDYLGLNLEEQEYLMEAFGAPRDLSAWVVGETDGPLGVGYSDTVRWNLLEHSDDALVDAFRRWISAQRHSKEVPEPRPLRARSGGTPCWRWPELLDLDHVGRLPRSPSAARGLCRARARADRLSSRFWFLLKREHRRGLRWPGLPAGTQSVSLA